MASDSQIGLKTVAKWQIYRQVTLPPAQVGGQPTKARLPIPSIVSPVSVEIQLGEETQDLMDMNCAGEEVIAFTYRKGIKPELNLNFSTAAPEMDSLIHGRLMEQKNNYQGFVYFDIDTVTGTTQYEARVSGEAGFTVTAQDAESTADIYYTDNTERSAKKIAIVASTATLAGNQMKIGAALAIEISPQLAAKEVTIRGWVPCTFTKALVIGSQSLGILTCYGMGVSFDNRYAGILVRNASRLPQGSLGSNPERQIKLRILPDANDGNGLGFQMFYTGELSAC